MKDFTLGCSKIEVSESYFFDIVTTQCDHPRYVKHVLGRPYVFFTFHLCVFHISHFHICAFGWSGGGGGGGGSPQGFVHNLLVHFFTLNSSKIEVFETYFFDVVTTQYDHPRYAKHVLGRIYVFFTLVGYWVRGGGGGQTGLGTQRAYAVFQPIPLKNRIFQNFFLDLVITQNDHPRYVKHV